MFRKQLVTHISNELSRGVAYNDISTGLLLDGWPQADIDEAYNFTMYPEKLKGFSLHRLLGTELPAWVEFLSLSFGIVVIVSMFIFFSSLRQKIYSYELNVPPRPDISKNILHYGAEPSLSDKNFFNVVKDQFAADKVSFVLADLAEMKVFLYQKGVLTDEFPILTKGKEGSWWETPAGLYKIETKNKNHFSSFGKVYQPWSMAFQGNFFIHGWPHYPDGTAVASTYSGGCIRLADVDAEKLFKAFEVGTPVLIYEKDFASDGRTYERKGPAVNAPYYFAADLKSGFVFTEKNDATQIPIASVTKLVTALVATDFLNLDRRVTISTSMIVPTSKSRLKVGQQISAYQLLFPLLLESSNEAAEALAQMSGNRKEFLEHMNDKASSIGMTHSSFTDPAGREDTNVSTIEDMFMLSKFLYNNRSFILNFTAGKIQKTAYGGSEWSDLQNYNDFEGNPEFVGGKTGKTTIAKETGLSIFDVMIDGEKRPIVIMVFGSENRKQDIERILSFVKNSFE